MKEEIIKKARPLPGHVLVKNIGDEKKTPGGILIPESHKEKNMMGIVTATSVSGIKEGDYILFGRYAGKEMRPEKLSDDTYRVVNFDDILARTNGTWDAIAPVSNYVLVEPEKAPEKIGKIYMPDNLEKPEFTKAKVVRVGPGRYMKAKGEDGNNLVCPMTVEEGDFVWYGPFVSYSLKKWGREFVIVRESDIEMMQSPKNEDGFSLVEMLVSAVILIMLIFVSNYFITSDIKEICKDSVTYYKTVGPYSSSLSPKLDKQGNVSICESLE